MISRNSINNGSRNLRPVKIKTIGECQVVQVGKMEIWDGAELALIRETLWRLVEEEACRSLAVDMQYVKYVPSGFFGMLYDWFEKGVCVRVLGPLPHVQQMLWFIKFFHSVADDFYELGPCLDDDFDEPTAERGQSQERVSGDDSQIASKKDRALELSRQNDENVHGVASASAEPNCTSTKCPPVAGILAK